MKSDYVPTPQDIKFEQIAKPYSDVMDMAFFVVQIGMTKKEYDQLTELEKMFLRKEYENKFVKDTTWMRNAVLNAEANANRGKNKRFQELFPKTNKADIEYNEDAIKNITEIEKNNGKSWVDKIYKANGKNKPIPRGKE
ncbi:phenylalanine racemase [Marinilactibacillus psychrotolerans]|nr:phenylalanine racemase [Marinilactibacillus psychrotolerans]